MKILAISAYYHDSAAVITVDGKIIAAVCEERFTRKKHDLCFPRNSIKFCLEKSNLKIDDLDAVIFYDKPWLKFERLMLTYNMYAPRGFKSFLEVAPVWAKEKLFLKKVIKDELSLIQKYNFEKLKLLFSYHHLSHTASAFYPSPFEKSAIITVDGVGEWATASISLGKANTITTLKELNFPHSLGLFYSAITYYLGFKVNFGEYKVMGLAPYGNKDSKEVLNYKKLLKENIIDIKEDGSCWLNQDYFDYSTGMKMTKNKKWKKLFGLEQRYPEGELLQEHCDFALACQEITEEAIINMAKTAKKLTNCDNLCLAGGIALNCVANSKIVEEKIFKNVWIQPAAGDAGGALGAALSAEYIYYGSQRIANNKDDIMQGSYLGPEYKDCKIEQTINQYKAVAQKIENEDILIQKTAKALAEGKVVGWFYGRAEWGPRALGNRSILGDPRNPNMQMKMNLKIKYRESFRPFAPSVTEEDAKKYFEIEEKSPYMLLTSQVNKNIRFELPKDYETFSIKDKLYYKRSELPAITHIDFSARLQTVSKEKSPRYYKLLKEFEKLSKYPILINTSFNVRGKPIVLTPEDAYKCFMQTQMDILVIENYYFKKENQPEWKNQDNWKKEFVFD